MNWGNKIQVKKGDFGEKVVRESLESKGYVIYKAITSGAHAFDFLAVKNKKIFLIAEVKSKARFNKYECTGFDVRSLNEYIFIMEQQKIDVVLFFVDEHPKEERIYCQKLSILMEEKKVNFIKYPNFDIAKGKVLFSLSDMVTVRKLKKEEIDMLKKYSSRTYDY